MLAHREIPIVFDLAIQNSSKNTIINCSNWGCYFNYALSNKNKLQVVFGDKIEYMRDLGKVSNKNQGNIIQIFQTNDVLEIKSGTKIWKVFKIDPWNYIYYYELK